MNISFNQASILVILYLRETPPLTLSSTFMADNMEIVLTRAVIKLLCQFLQHARLSTARVEDRSQLSDTQVFKAVEAALGDIVGFVCLTLEHGNEDKPGFGVLVPTPTATATHQMPPGLNISFIMTTGAGVESLKSHMKGMKHYWES